MKLSKTQNPTTAEDRERMKVIPYASVIGSIKYAMLCVKPVVYLAMSLARRYNSDPGVDHWTTVKIILSYWMTKKMFLDYGGDKEFVDASFDTNPDDSKYQSGCILKVGAIS